MIQTLSPIAFRRALPETQPHPTAQYWRKCQVEALFNQPFLELVFQAASVHRQHFDPQKIQLSTLLSIKTGGCPKIANTAPNPPTTTQAWKNKPY